VPNVSEGRDGTIIERIAKSIARTGCNVLDIHSDHDHHRSVFTMIGDEKQIADGAVALTESAVALIDLGTHCGVHPRIGAVDVVPVVPLGATEMADCVAVAQHIGRTIADRWALPVYLYGMAARSAYRSSLPQIRRGGFEGLSKKLAEMRPDFGPRQPHPTAGAVAVGARHLLVAFNVVLDTAEVAIAREIALAIREANGGLPGVKALGLSLDSRNLAQVSMNLTDITATTIPAAFRAVSREAEQVGVRVLESEIVGLVPKLALDDATAADLLMQDDPRERILETRIAKRMT
ncbi:glutamate formimidoyltransferase, partial [Candidatus Bipolaricaulota bacterium]|nr:glutamate formimidoyltransferase [Candidatus Bipolaricaulota bacterium]